VAAVRRQADASAVQAGAEQSACSVRIRIPMLYCQRSVGFEARGLWELSA
jgi:head-tail adaptor